MHEAQQTVGVIGLGLLGRGIAANLLASGIRVVGFTHPASGFASARESIDRDIADLVAHGELPASARPGWTTQYAEAGTLDEMSECSFIIESIPEDVEVKNRLFEQLERTVGESTPIATNTSAIPISMLQSGKRNPRRFIGMHFLAPCHITRFLEVIRGEQTDDATVHATIELARRAGKDPSLVNKDIAGFIANRLAYALYREAFHLLELGIADVETIDRTARNVLGLWAPVAGPFRWMDLTGLPAYAAAMERLFPTLSNATVVPGAMKHAIEQGHSGISSGRGFYEYSPQDPSRWQTILREQAWEMRRIGARLSPPTPIDKLIQK